MLELAVSFLMNFFFFPLLENVDSPQLRFSQTVVLHWSFCCVIFSTELLEGKKGEKKREKALHFGIIKAHEKPQTERFGLCSGSAWAKLPKLMSLSSGPIATRGWWVWAKGRRRGFFSLFLSFYVLLLNISKEFCFISVWKSEKNKSLCFSWEGRAALCLALLWAALGSEIRHPSRWDTFNLISLSV